jgi:hypothetical protein
MAAASVVTEVMLAVKVLSAQMLGDIDGAPAVLSTRTSQTKQEFPKLLVREHKSLVDTRRRWSTQIPSGPVCDPRAQ